MLKSGVPTDLIGNVQTDRSNIVVQATKFTATCYGEERPLPCLRQRLREGKKVKSPFFLGHNFIYLTHHAWIYCQAIAFFLLNTCLN